MRTINLSDSFRIFLLCTKTVTRIQITSFTTLRLDFILVPNSRTSCTQSTNVLRGIRSDHRVVKLVLRFNQFKIGLGYWKFNNDLLDGDNYKSFTKQEIANYKSNNPAKICNPQLRWDTLKCVVSGYTIQFSVQKRRRLLIKQNSLERKLQLLQNLLCCCLPAVKDKLLKILKHVKLNLINFMN